MDNELTENEYKYFFCIAAMFKNESLCLEEWINHYISRGVEHIYLINDFSDDDYKTITDRYADSVSVFHSDIVTNDVGKQVKVYDKYLKPILHETTWLGIVDLDEFLYSPTNENIIDILKKYENYSSLRVDWLSFGSNGHKNQPLSLVSGFTKRAVFNNKSEMLYSYKSITKTSQIKNSIGIHSTDVSGAVFQFAYHDDRVPSLVINHYQIQSENFWKEKKCTKGDSNNWRVRTFDEFYKRDALSNDVKDVRLFQQNKKRNVIPSIPYHNDDKDDDVTLIITSCNRPAQLKTTLESFIQMNTYPISKTYIIEDSGVIGCNDEITKPFIDQLHIELIYNKKNIGQVPSIDKVYSYVKTKWIFHCEEDWQFLQPSFIEKSLKVFKENPNEKIYTVWLRPHHDTSGHPIIKDHLQRGYFKMSPNFSYIDNGVIYTWCGVTFNPGLRKTSDCLLLHPYEINCETSIDKKGNEYVGEYTINKKYNELGYFSYILDDSNGHVTHIGWHVHISRPWE
jgi:hypothetical protein